MTTRERVTRAAKIAVASALYYAGVLHLWRAVMLRRRAVVLMYHRVLTAEERQRTASHPGIVVSDRTFEHQMKLLRRSFSVLSLDEFAERLDSRAPFPRSACLITFDDGWRDGYSNVLPILERHGLPAVIFLPVNFIGRCRVFWQESLTRLLLMAAEEARRSPERRVRLQQILEAQRLDRILDAPELNLKLSVIDAVGSLKRLPIQALQALQRALAEELGVRVEEFADIDGFMNWQQVQSMSTRGIAFGGHGAEHLLLTQIAPEAVASEVQTAKREIERQIPMGVKAFCYPNGSWNPQVARVVQDSGYQLAFTTEAGTVDSRDNRFALRRVNIHEDMTDTPAMFLARLVGLF